MKNTANIISIFLFTLLFTLSVFAQASDEVLTFEVYTPSTVIFPCETAEFSFEIGNFGVFEEVYELSVDNFEEYAVFSENPVALLPGETKEVTLFVTPECHVYGDHTIRVFIRNQALGTTYEDFVDLAIEPEDIAIIAEEVDTLQVDYAKNKLSLPIQNIGNRETTYELFLEGESWVSLEESEITVGPRRTEKISLLSSPPESTEEGDYELAVIAKVKDTGVEYGKEFTLTLAEPGFLVTFYNENKTIVFGGIALLILFAVLGVILAVYLHRTKDERAARKEEKRKEKELARLEKEKEKEARLKEKEDAKLAKQQEKERLAKEKEDAKLAKEQEREQARLDKEKEREDRIKEREDNFISRKKDALKAILRHSLHKEFVYVDKETLAPVRAARVLPLIAAVIILIAAVVLGVYFWSSLSSYLWYIVGGVLIVVLLVLGFVMLRRRRADKLQTLFEERNEYSAVVEETKADLGLTAYLIERQAVETLKPTQRVFLPLLFSFVFVGFAVASYFLRSYLFGYAFYVSFGLVLVAGLFFLLFLTKLAKKKTSVCTVAVNELLANKTVPVQMHSRYGLGEVLIRAKNAIRFAYVSVHKHDRLPTFVVPNNEVFGVFELKSAGLSDKDIDKSTFRFSVPRKWLSKHAIAQDRVRLERYNGTKWVGITDVSVISKDDKQVTFEAAYGGLGILAITGKANTEKTSAVKKKDKAVTARTAAVPAFKKKPSSKKKQKITKPAKKKQERDIGHWLTVIFAGIFILLIVLTVVAGLYSLSSDDTVAGSANDIAPATSKAETLSDSIAEIDPTAPASGIGPIIFVSGSSAEVDMTKFFADPDGDSLDFSHSGGYHLTVEYTNGHALISAAAGYSGTDELTFIATDANGDSVESNLVSVVIEAPSGLQKIQHFFLNRYVSSILLILGIVVLVLLAFELRKRLSDEEDEFKL